MDTMAFRSSGGRFREMDSQHRPRRSWWHDHRHLIHQLNQRYYRQWHRAEQLQREVDRYRRWLGGPLRLAKWLRRCLLPVAEIEVIRPVCQPLVESATLPTGKVSLIIPFRDQPALLRNCLASLRQGTFTERELILLDNGSIEPRTHRLLRKLCERNAARVIDCSGPFNFSRLCNQGAQQATGDWLLFLNNDTEVLTPAWLERMLAVAGRPDVGVVGATLLYPGGTIQHAGLFPTPAGRWVHADRGRDLQAVLDEQPAVRRVPAVTAACLLIRRSLFESLGGFNEALPLTYNDIELCCRVRQRGLHVALTAHARLLHYEGISRGFSPDEPGTAHLRALPRFPERIRERQD